MELNYHIIFRRQMNYQNEKRIQTTSQPSNIRGPYIFVLVECVRWLDLVWTNGASEVAQQLRPRKRLGHRR